VLGLYLDHLKKIRNPMQTINANAIKTVGKEEYDIMVGHAIFSSVETGHHTLFDGA